MRVGERRSHLLRSRLDSQVHRTQLALAAVVGAQPGQLAQPRHDSQDPYVPRNRPAIGDLFNLFDFGERK